METDNEIYFYYLNNKFAYMSNYYKTKFKDKYGIEYNCSEQYFIYWKARTFVKETDDILDKILDEKSPVLMVQYGRRIPNYDDAIWQVKRYDIMLEAVRLKFKYNFIINQKLLDTKNQTLYEASQKDAIWGIGFYDKEAINTDKRLFGSNLLGKALMEIRSDFRMKRVLTDEHKNTKIQKY